MKNRTFLFSLVVLPLAALLTFVLFPGQNQREYTPRDARVGQTIGGASEYWNMIRSNQVTGEVDPADIAQALEDMKRLGRSKSSTWSWDEMGPDNLGGRTRAIIFDVNDPTVMYAGAVSGGLWKSTTAGSSWQKVASISDNMIVASITQAPNGDIYVGTGEGFYPGSGTGTAGFDGNGIYKSTDGENFTHLAPTASWRYVNNMAVCPGNGTVYAATSSGIKASNDNGVSWNVSLTFTPNTPNLNGDDIEVASDGTVYAVMNRNFFVAENGVDFTRKSGTGFSLPTGGSRMEIAVAPSDPNYVYALLAQANGYHQGAWRSTDKGSTWTQIAPAYTASFDIFRSQGSYNNAIEVFPNNKDKIIVGGIDIWTWELGGTWTQITSGNFSHSSPLYVHVDIHEFAFHPTNPNIVFVGCDGGIHRSTDGGATWVAMNKNYGTIQYYHITSSGSGQVMGGTQDNSYQFIDFKGNTPGAARTVWGGDGGYAAISQLNPDAYYVSSQYGSVGRTPDGGLSWQRAYGATPTDAAFFNTRMLAEGTPGQNFASFVTPLALWETVHAFDSKDSVMFVADTNYLAGEVVTIRVPKKNDYPFRHTLLAGLSEGDSMMIQNPVQSVFVVAARNAVWMTRDPLNYSGTPEWFKLGTTAAGNIINIQFSADGDHLFAGTSGGRVYRFSNLRQAYDSTSADMGSAANPNLNQIVTKTVVATYNGRAVTSIAVDPLNNDHVVVTLGNYGNAVYVYRSTDATSAAPTFTGKQGAGASTRLPLFPVYSALIPLNHPNTLIVGTEYGTYMTENVTAANPVWVEVNDGMDRVPALHLHQMVNNFPYNYVVVGEGDNMIVIEYHGTQNYGGIYVGTHGRGAFRNLNFVSVNRPQTEKPSSFRSQLLVYPNPIVSNATAVVNLNQSANAVVKVYDLNGRVVASLEPGMLQSGRNEIKLQLDHLRTGNYVVQVIVGGESKTAKIIKR